MSFSYTIEDGPALEWEQNNSHWHWPNDLSLGGEEKNPSITLLLSIFLLLNQQRFMYQLLSRSCHPSGPKVNTTHAFMIQTIHLYNVKLKQAELALFELTGHLLPTYFISLEELLPASGSWAAAMSWCPWIVGCLNLQDLLARNLVLIAECKEKKTDPTFCTL